MSRYELMDGVYAASLLQERFITSLTRGEVPAPLLDRSPQPLQSRIVFISPESLVTKPQTILAGLGLTNAALLAALESTKRLCSRCGALVNRYSSPSDLLAAIAQDWHGKTISIYLHSPSERFSEWVSAHGFSLVSTPASIPASIPASTPTSSPAVANSIHLDRLVCSVDALAHIGAAVHSIWQLPQLQITCIDRDGAQQSYSPTGWCATCNNNSERISKSELLSVLTEGSSNDTVHDASARPEELLVIEALTTVRELLGAPLGQLRLSPSSPFFQARELLSELSLGMCTFGTRTNELDAPGLALVAIIATVLAVSDPHDQIIANIPSNILDARDTAVVTRLLQRSGANCQVSMGALSEFAPHSIPSLKVAPSDRPPSSRITFSLSRDQSRAPLNFALCAGEMVRITRDQLSSNTLFYDLTTQLAHSQRHAEMPMPLVTIPLFNRLDHTGRVVGQELGLIEPLTHLYAASLDARSQGLSAKDFMLFGTRNPRYACPHCCGLGVVLDYHPQLPQALASHCAACDGLRCRHPVSSVLFRGISFPATLNQPIERCYSTLAALAKTKRPLEISATLGLHHLSLGMPVALLDPPERRKLAIASALCKGRTAKPVIVALEAPEADLYGELPGALDQVRDAALEAGQVIWLEVVYRSR